MIENQWTSSKDIQNKMITNFKLFESIFDFSESDTTEESFKKALHQHISGTLSWNESYKLVEYCQSYFNWKIPQNLKYQGDVYRIFQFKDYEFDTYQSILKNGVSSHEKQRYWSCTKDIESIEKIKKFLSHNQYTYYIIFKFDVKYNDVLFDINKMYDYLYNTTSEYVDENEVIVLSWKLTLPPENIIKYGEI
jgi:hypothetical protein